MSLSPFSAQAGGGDLNLTVQGSSFVSASVVQWNGRNRSTTFTSSNLLTAAISSADIANAAIAQVTVSNPAPGGGTSPILRFGIDSPPAVGRFVYVGNTDPDNISAFSINPSTGVLSEIANSPFASTSQASTLGSLVVDPFGKFLFAASLATIGCKSCNSLSVFQIGSAGQLTPVSGSPFPITGPAAIDPSGNLLIASSTFLIDASTGAPIPVGKVEQPIPATSWLVYPKGGFLYAPILSSQAPSDGIFGASIDSASANVNVLTGSPFNSNDEYSQNSIAMDPLGSFVFESDDRTAFGAADVIVSLNVGSAGTLIASRVLNPGVFGGMAVHPSGNFLYATDSLLSVVAFSVDRKTGTLTQVGSPYSTGGITPNSAAIDASGSYLFVANGSPQNQGSVSAFSIDSNTGALTPIAGSPYQTGIGSQFVVVSP